MLDEPFWKPSEDTIKKSNIYKMMQQQGFKNYADFWKWSVNKKEDFWKTTIDRLGIQFDKKYKAVLDVSQGVENANWLPGAKLNIADSCFQNSDEATAIIYQKPGKKVKKVTQFELKELVNRIANGLIELGLKKGAKIAINMPMTVEAVAIYLAGIKAGFPVVTIADSFSEKEIEIRLKITKPMLLFTQDYISRAGKSIPLYEKNINAGAPKTILLTSTRPKKIRSQDIVWNDFLSSNTSFSSIYQKPEDFITILFSSGTTGEPKAIPWTHTTPIKSASDGFYHQNIQQNDVVCWPTNLGWMMGPWLVFATLINKSAIALYDGSPTESEFGEFVQNAKVSMLGVIPSFVKTWKLSKCMENYDWNSIKCFSSTGEVSNPQDMEYLMSLANKKPVIEYCGGTEIGGGYVTSTVVQPNIASTFSTQALGGAFVLLDQKNKKSIKGEVFIVPPVLGLSTSLLNKNHFDVYYKNTPTYKNQKLRRHGDEMLQLKNGYFKAQGRVDDAMNLGGIKVSSVQFESVINSLEFIKESAAISVAIEGGGPGQLVIYYVNNTANDSEKNHFFEVKNIIKKQLNPLFKLKELIKIEVLPRTASNKIMRRKLRDLYVNKTQIEPSTK